MAKQKFRLIFGLAELTHETKITAADVEEQFRWAAKSEDSTNVICFTVSLCNKCEYPVVIIITLIIEHGGRLQPVSNNVMIHHVAGSAMW